MINSTSQNNSKFSYLGAFSKRCIRVIVDAARGFVEDDCYSKASALTFYSLLSIVPVLAVLFGIAKGFGFENALRGEISQYFIDQQEMIDKLIEFAYSWLKSVQGGLIAGVGTIALLWSVIGLLTNVETALNAVWKISIARSYGRKISDYLAAMIVFPIFFIASSSMTIFINTQIVATAHNYAVVDIVSPVLLFILKLFPFFLSWILLTCVYLLMPNTKVYWRSALIAGILAGTTFQLWQWIYIRFQLGASSYGAIYGSFAALPLFLIWLQASWLIVLAGAEIAFEIENDLFVPFRERSLISIKAAALLITYRCIESFVKEEPPQTDRMLAYELGLSLNHLHHIIYILQKERILSASVSQSKMISYQPACTIEHLTFAKICQAVENSFSLMASFQNSQTMQHINSYMQQLDNANKQFPNDQPIYATLSSKNSDESR